jgi:starch synthase (maltosyl-transferring)
MGFNCLVTAPVFAPGRDGNIFLTGDFERAHPLFRSDAGADDVVAEIANKCHQNELELIVDIVLGRVDANGALATSHSTLFAAPPSGDRVVDPDRKNPRPARGSIPTNRRKNSLRFGTSDWVACSTRELLVSGFSSRIMCPPTGGGSCSRE